MSEADGQLEIDNVGILVFSVDGVRFGTESGQIAAIDPERTGVGFKIIKLNALLGLADGTDKDAGVLLELRQECSTNRLLLVDKIEDILEIPLSEIQLLPEVIAERVLQRGIWGVIQQGDNILLLIDFNRLLKNIDSSSSEKTASTNIQASQEDTI